MVLSWGSRCGQNLRPWLLIAMVCMPGCAPQTVGPVRVRNSVLGPMTIAVAPALNVSGSPDLDVNQFADLMASELSYVDDVRVIPVNRVLAVLKNQGRERVESAGHALELAGLIGADAILVFSATEFDPYDPPVVGISAQLYGRRPRAASAAFNPVEVSRYGAPSPDIGISMAVPGILAESTRVFDASHDRVRHEVRKFARRGQSTESPLGWRKHLASQRHYLRFCCYATIASLFSDTEVGMADAGTKAGSSAGASN